MNKAYLLLLCLVGLINFIPVIGVISLEKVNQLYGLSASDNNLALLLRHRALLFGIVGGVIIYSVFNAQYQNLAMVLAALSMVGFMVLSMLIGDTNEELLKVFKADIAGVLLLIAAFVLKLVAID